MCYKKNLIAIIYLILVLSISYCEDIYLNELNKAIELYDDGDFTNSLNILKELEKSEIKDKRLSYYLGQNYFEQSQFSIAEMYYKEAIEIDAEYPDPYIELSTIKINQRKTEEAHEYVKKALKLNPNSATAHLNYSSVLTLLGKDAESKKEIYKAAKLDPMLVMSHGMQFTMYYNEHNAALYYLNIVEELYPAEPLVLLNKGHVLKIIGEAKTASEYYKYAYKYLTKKHPAFGVIWSTYFRDLFNSGKYDDIVNNLLEKVNTKYPSVYYFLALINYKKNKIKEFNNSALEYFKLEKKEVPEDLNKWAEENTKIKK